MHNRCNLNCPKMNRKKFCYEISISLLNKYLKLVSYNPKVLNIKRYDFSYMNTNFSSWDNNQKFRSLINKLNIIFFDIMKYKCFFGLTGKPKEIINKNENEFTLYDILVLLQNGGDCINKFYKYFCKKKEESTNVSDLDMFHYKVAYNTFIINSEI